jgi:hypothetical protein
VDAHARAAQAQVDAEEVARQAHWANALAEGQARRVAEEREGQRAMQRAKAEMLELTPGERRRLANLRPHDFWGPPRSGGAGPSDAGGGTGTSRCQ